MKILVTGGLGFIGSNFVRKCIGENLPYEILVLDSHTYASNQSALSEFRGRFDLVDGDIRDANLVSMLVKSSDAVINFAAETHNDNSLVDPLPFLESNIIGTYTLLEACREGSVRYHQVSTDEVYGDLPLGGEEKFTRNSPYLPSSPYSATKASADMLVRAWVRSFDVSATISNCSNNFGPYQHPEKLIPRTISLVMNGHKPKIYGDGSNVRDWIHVDDHVDGILAILERGERGETYLLGANSEKTNLEVVQSILRIMGKADD